MKLFGRKNKKNARITGEENPSSPRALDEASDESTTNQDDEVPKGWNPGRFVELGTIEYVNLTEDGKHGDFDAAVDAARRTGKPIFANFVEWSGCAGCKDAGAAIFADPIVRRAAEELFVPCAFNTWDRHDSNRNKAVRRWGAGLDDS